MTFSAQQFVVVFILLGFCVSFAFSSSASEPAFKSQLRSCFEANRNTDCIVNQGRWNSCGRSSYSSYQLAVSISMNCMRSVCGNQNGLCCNTYCTMFGLSGSDHSYCFSTCFNPSTGGHPFGSNSANFGGDTSAGASDVSVSDSSVSCSIPCSSTFSFFENKLALSQVRKPVELKKYKKLVKRMKRGKRIVKKLPAKPVKKSFAKTLSTISSPTTSYFSSARPNIVLDGSQYNQVLRTTIDEAVPSNLNNAQFSNPKVPANQICSSSMKDNVDISVLKSTGVECSKISQWIRTDKTIAAENLENVYNFLLVLHKKCSALPNSQCVMPNVASIKLTGAK